MNYDNLMVFISVGNLFFPFSVSDFETPRVLGNKPPTGRFSFFKKRSTKQRKPRH